MRCKDVGAEVWSVVCLDEILDFIVDLQFDLSLANNVGNPFGCFHSCDFHSLIVLEFRLGVKEVMCRAGVNECVFDFPLSNCCHLVLERNHCHVGTGHVRSWVTLLVGVDVDGLRRSTVEDWERTDRIGIHVSVVSGAEVTTLVILISALVESLLHKVEVSWFSIGGLGTVSEISAPVA